MRNPRFRVYQLPNSPLVRLGLVLAAIAILALSFLVGVFVLAIAAGLAIIGTVVLAVRNLFAGRRRKPGDDRELLDVEYRVIRKERDRERDS